jgi:hypothetical protein
MDMFRQIAPEGIVNKQTVDPKYPNGSLHKSDFVPEDTASLAPALQKHVDVSEAIKASEEHSTVIDNSVHRRKYERSGECTLADHEPGGPQLPHESSQETTSASDVSEGSSESMDAQEHEVLTAKALADKTLFQANTGDKAESVSVLTSSEDQLGSQSKKCKVYSDESISKTESDVVEGRIKSESSEAKITFEVGHAEVKPGEGDAKIEGAKIENAQIKADGGVRQVDSDEAEAQAKPDEAGAVAASKRSLETKITHEEMNRITPAECPFLNRE